MRRTKQKLMRTLRTRKVRSKKVTPTQMRKMLQESPLPKYLNDGRFRIAIVQTGAWGDNINSTLMFEPIKKHFEGCLLDVHTSTKYGDAFANNPHVDNIFYHKATTKNSALNLALTIPEALKNRGYSKIISPHPMYNSDKWNSLQNPEWGENLIFAWVRALEELEVPYGNKLTTVLKLTDPERAKVRSFINEIKNFKTSRNILLEIEGESGQTFWSPQWTIDVGNHLLDGNTNLFISHRDQRGDIVNLADHNVGHVYWVGDLSIRECAGLFNNCDAFFSVSSGLSNACNTNWCKNDVKWIEVVNSITCSSAAIRKCNKIFWHENDITAFLQMLTEEL